MNTDAPALLTYQQAADRLGVSKSTIRRLVDSGQIDPVRVSERAPRLRATDVDNFPKAAS